MGVARELLPCPLPFSGGPIQCSGPVSRVVRRRFLRKQHWQQWANEGVAALNDLYGAGVRSDTAGADISAAQMFCLDNIAEAYCRVGPPPADCASAAGAFNCLLYTSPSPRDS